MIAAVATGKVFSASIAQILSTLAVAPMNIQLPHLKVPIVESGQTIILQFQVLSRDIFLSSNHRNVGLTVLQKLMASEHFQRLQSVWPLTEAEKMVLDILPSCVTATGFSESRRPEQAKDRLLRFEGEHGRLKFFSVWEAPTRTYQLRFPGLHSMFDNTDARLFGVGQREADIIGGLLTSAVRAVNFMSGRIACYSRYIRLLTAFSFQNQGPHFEQQTSSFL
jgi:hypothetical protein